MPSFETSPTASPSPTSGSRASGALLVAANALPLAGVLAWGWEVFPLLVLFWMENVVVGALNALKILLAAPGEARLWAAKAFTLPFFCFHYGLFTLLHGVFVLTVFGGKGYEVHDPLSVLGAALRAASDYGLWLAGGVLAASHAFSFAWNYLRRGEFRAASPKALMAQPYGRVMVLHLVIIVGGFGALALGSPLWALVLLVVLKTALDLRAHVKEHSPSP